MNPGSTPQDGQSENRESGSNARLTEHDTRKALARPALDFGLRDGSVLEHTAREALNFSGEKMSFYWSSSAVVQQETELDANFDWREQLYLEHEELRLSLKNLEDNFGTAGPTAFISVVRGLPDNCTRFYDRIAIAAYSLLNSGEDISRLTTLTDGLSRIPPEASNQSVLQYIEDFSTLAERLHDSRFALLTRAQDTLMEATHYTSLYLLRTVADFVENDVATQTERTAFRVLKRALEGHWCPVTCFAHATQRNPRTPTTLAYVASQLSKNAPIFKDEKIPLTLEYENRVDFILNRQDLELLREQSRVTDRKTKTLGHALNLLESARASVPERKGAREALLQRTGHYVDNGISPAKAILEFVRDIKLGTRTELADAAVTKLLYPKSATKSERGKASDYLADDYGSDQHPVPKNDTKTYSHYFGQTAQVFRGILDEYRGFAALKYAAQHLPPGEHSDLARIGIDLAASAAYVHAGSNMIYPGKGVIIDGMDPARFLSTQSNTDDPYSEHKKANPWLANAIDTMPECRQLFLRGCIAIIPPDDTDNPLFTINLGEGRHEPYAYIVFNDHFQNVGNHKAFLVPSIILQSKLSQTVIPTELWEEGVESAPHDINHRDLTPLGLFAAAERYGAPVLNLGTPSVYCGGLVNAFPVASAPYWKWEEQYRKKGNAWTDGHGHKHKSFITGFYVSSMSQNERGPEQLEKFAKLLQGHTDIFETVRNFQTIRALFKFAHANWNKGLTLSKSDDVEAGSEGQEWDLGIKWKDQKDERPGIKSESDAGPNIDPIDAMMGDSTPSPRIHPNSFRMLDKAIEVHDALLARGKVNPDDFPVLVPTMALRYTMGASEEFELDTYDMILRLRGGKEIDLSSNKPREQIELAWAQHVLPLFDSQLVDLRFLEKGDD